jgi:hypothetical protein
LKNQSEQQQFDDLVSEIYRLLESRFPNYEAAASLTQPSEAFRLQLAIAITEFFGSARPPKIAQKRHELELEKRDAARRADIARLDIRRYSQSPEVKKALEAEYDKHHVSWLAAQLWQDDLRGRRRPRLHAFETCVRNIATAYTAATGRQPTIVTNKAHDPPETGSFADLLRAINNDVRPRIKAMSPDCMWPQWSGSIVRYAKRLRLTSAEKG